MSYRTSAAQHHQDHHPAHHRPQERAATVRRHQAPADYTLGHRGRQVRLGPVAFWIVVGTLVSMALWTVGTGTYFAFRDDVLTRLIGHQTEMQYAYEDRIAELRAQIDRISGRQLLDQNQFEGRLEQLIRKQSELESRSSAMLSLTDGTPTGSISRTKRHSRGRPSPLDGASLEIQVHTASAGGFSLFGHKIGKGHKGGNLESTFAKLDASMTRLAQVQDKTLDAAKAKEDGKSKRIRSLIGSLGLNPDKIHSANDAVGGPFIPVKPKRNASDFDHRVYQVNLARAQADSLAQTLRVLPVRKPLDGELVKTSGFGVRMDPFFHQPAMHTGFDFRGTVGEDVHATAAGRVKSAGWAGGYGKMVEIDHGNGLSTRYGHLSEIKVGVGQYVKAGQTVGHVGSTGRSTGPHLHYETRINNEAVSPQRFLDAANQVGKL
jgi:murein DD-endopeptidase MepM/ murein hydrolase activator NlpD